ncbi:LutC/YkgG family protein [Rothia terrae]|uniref:LUD domain-containing protein n=1 Tax=Rothia terrae TaxID=396015 RepID=A0A7H2BEQ8_9MICC|nr:LUD domain-containing protein [Rothia terrae]QNV38154.1 LUD domain-containing protein [Rothia terrae]
MSDAKAEILGRIRSSLSDHPQPAEPIRNYRKVSDKSQAEVLEMLIDRLVDYKANVFEETEETIAQRIAEQLGKSSHYVVPTGLKNEWLPEDTAARTRMVDSGNDQKSGALSLRELDAVDAVVTSSTVSCAETGTIFLTSQEDEGRRAITLVPDHHICVVPLDTVVELIPESMRRVDFNKPVTMISGPSATSDIELIRVEGVHGPRTLDVIILK